MCIRDRAHTLLFLVSPHRPVGLDLRLAGHIAEVVQSDHFTDRWINAGDDKALNAILMRDDHFYHGPVETMPFLVEQLGRTVAELELPTSCILALIERDGELVIPTPEVTLLAFDGVAIIGEPDDIQLLNDGLDPFEARQAALAAAEDDESEGADSDDSVSTNGIDPASSEPMSGSAQGSENAPAGG